MRRLTPLSLVNQLALLMLLLAAIGLIGMSLSGWLSWRVQGNAHAINQAGSLRMQSYRLLAAVPLSDADNALLATFDATLENSELRHTSAREQQNARLQQLDDYWRSTLRPALLQASNQNQVRDAVRQFVSQIDTLVSAIDSRTEQRLALVTTLQYGLVAVMVLLQLFALFWLRRRLLTPWRKLIVQAEAIGQGDFSQRTLLRGEDEMATLARTLGSMSQELAQSYARLEQRVLEKTAGLQQKHEELSFLYRASLQLHGDAPLSQRLTRVESELQRLLPLTEVRIEQYDAQSDTRVTDNDPDDTHSFSWLLADEQLCYGRLSGQLASGQRLNAGQRQLLATLAEQITATLSLARQSDYQQQLVVMEERAAIARELHDSIAQSLSFLKIQLSCIQMQGEQLPETTRQQLATMRQELNASWRQLRELLATFRLRFSEPGLQAALTATCHEFSERLGFEVALQAPARLPAIPPHQAIHLVHIVREALNNIYKHAHADAAGIVVQADEQQIALTVWDNGRGITSGTLPENHYGLIIMRDRAQHLGGLCTIAPRAAGGTEVRVQFPRFPLANSPGEYHE